MNVFNLNSVKFWLQRFLIKCTLKYLQGCKTHAISNQININDE